MGVFCEVLHLPPREVELLTVEQFDALAEYITARMKDG